MGGEGSPWAPPYVTARAPSLWRRTGYKGLLSSYTHNFIRILYPIPRRRVRIALYNCLFARSIITHCHGLGYKIPPWGKGLSNKHKGCLCSGFKFPALVRRREGGVLLPRIRPQLHPSGCGGRWLLRQVSNVLHFLYNAPPLFEWKNDRRNVVLYCKGMAKEHERYRMPIEIRFASKFCLVF